MAHTFVYDLDFAIEELVSLDALVSATRRDLEMMRAHQDYAFKIEDADGDNETAIAIARDQMTLATNRYNAAKEKMKHFLGCIGAAEQHLQVWSQGKED